MSRIIILCPRRGEQLDKPECGCAQASGSSPAPCSVRRGMWQKSPKKKIEVRILGDHPEYPYALRIWCRGGEMNVLKSEVTEIKEAPNDLPEPSRQ